MIGLSSRAGVSEQAEQTNLTAVSCRGHQSLKNGMIKAAGAVHISGRCAYAAAQCSTKLLSRCWQWLRPKQWCTLFLRRIFSSWTSCAMIWQSAIGMAFCAVTRPCICTQGPCFKLLTTSTICDTVQMMWTVKVQSSYPNSADSSRPECNQCKHSKASTKAKTSAVATANVMMRFCQYVKQVLSQRELMI